MDIPFFLPTSQGAVTSFLTLPDSGSLRDPAVLLLPGGRAGAGVLPLFQKVARVLAEAGQPVLRIDYPGSGLSGLEEVLPSSGVGPIAGEIASWLLRETGLQEVAVGGRCSGARVALAVAAREPSVKRVVGIVPFLQQGGRSLRSTLGRLDAKGPRLAARLIRRPRVQTQPDQRDRPGGSAVATELERSLRTASVSFLFGENDPSLAEFEDWVASSGIAPDVIDRVRIDKLPGGRLHGLPDVEHERAAGVWLQRRLSEQAPALDRPG